MVGRGVVIGGGYYRDCCGVLVVIIKLIVAIIFAVVGVVLGPYLFELISKLVG